MSTKRVLITGGAGFIGSHLADELLRHGHEVRVLDVLASQVHGPRPQRPAYLDPDVELIVGDVRDKSATCRALERIDAVFHFAAAVGVGQSMYEIAHYISTNGYGTGVLLEALIERPVGRLVVASSMSVYGEGLYADAQGRVHSCAARSLEQLKAGDWELRALAEPLRPLPTPETKPPDLSSVYALSKWDQEQLCLMIGRTYGIPTVALRFFNVYGPRQALSNPYTGVLAIFASRVLNNKPALIYEDGLQRRDFVSVHDVATACRLALDSADAPGHVFNIGSGQSYTIRQIALAIAQAVNKEQLQPSITGKYRAGDIRHCFADITRARSMLEYEPAWSIDKGLRELAAWLEDQTACDRVEEASVELAARGLTL